MYEYAYEYAYQPSGLSIGASIILGIFSLVCMWKIFVKAGKPGWAAIVPFYNLYVLFDIAYGKGWKFLLLLIPFANIVFAILVYVQLAKAFGKAGGFAAGLIFLYPIFAGILAFDDSITYKGITV